MTTSVATKPATKRAARPTARTAKATTKSRPTTDRKEETKTTASVAQPAPAKADATSATDPKATRYADASVAESIAARLSGVRVLGFTRPALMELTGLTASAVWRAENRRVHPGEVEVVTAALDQIDRGEAQPPESRRASGSSRTGELRARIDAACQELADAVKTEKSLAALRKRVSGVLAVLAD